MRRVLAAVFALAMCGQVSAQQYLLEAGEGATAMLVQLAEVGNKCLEAAMLNDSAPLSRFPSLGPDSDYDLDPLSGARFQLADELGIGTIVSIGDTNENGLGDILLCFLNPDLAPMSPAYFEVFNWMDSEVRRLGALPDVEYQDLPGTGNFVAWCEPLVGVMAVFRVVNRRDDIFRLAVSVHRFSNGEFTPSLPRNMSIACTEATS